MAKKNNVTHWFIKNLFALSAIVVAIANLWLFARLAPLSQDIAIIKTGVLANEGDIESLRENIYGELKYLRERIDQIYNLTR